MERPRDACPYPKPFQPDFDGCPAFLPRQFIPLDTLYQPLEPVLTCRHLQTRSLPERYRWYAACGLGDPQARRRWAADIGTSRLIRIRALQRQIGEVMAPYSARLWSLKGQQLRALRDHRDPQPTTAELRREGANVVRVSRSFVDQHQAAFAEVEMPAAAAQELIELAVLRFIEMRSSAEISLEVPDDVLARFPAAVRQFFRPDLVDVGAEAGD